MATAKEDKEFEKKDCLEPNLLISVWNICLNLTYAMFHINF